MTETETNNKLSAHAHIYKFQKSSETEGVTLSSQHRNCLLRGD